MIFVCRNKSTAMQTAEVSMSCPTCCNTDVSGRAKLEGCQPKNYCNLKPVKYFKRHLSKHLQKKQTAIKCQAPKKLNKDPLMKTKQSAFWKRDLCFDANGQVLLQVGYFITSSLEPLPNWKYKVEVNNKKPNWYSSAETKVQRCKQPKFQRLPHLLQYQC